MISKMLKDVPVREKTYQCSWNHHDGILAETLSVGIRFRMDHGVQRSALQEPQHPVDDGEGGVDAHRDIDSDLKASLRRQSEIEQEKCLLDSPMQKHPVDLLHEQPLCSLSDCYRTCWARVSYLGHFLQLSVW